MVLLAPDDWDSWLCRLVCWWARYSLDGGGCNLACTRRGTRFLTCHWLLLPSLPHLCDLFIDPVEFHESARHISGLGLVVGTAVIDWGRTFDTRLFALDFWDPATLLQFPPDFAIKPTYFLASVMLVMFFLFLGNNDRALCISRCKQNRTYA